MMDAITLLLEERSIHRLLDTWSEAMDRHDWDAVEQCLAEEFTLLVPPIVPEGEPKARASAVAEMATRNAGFGSFHCLASKRIELGDNVARVRARLIGGQWTRDRRGWEVAFGYYDIKLVRELGEWRICGISLEFSFDHGPGFADSPPGNAMQS